MPLKKTIAIDLGGTNIKIALLDHNLKIWSKSVLSTRNFFSKAGLIAQIADSVKTVISENNLKKTEINGVGIGLPGPIDAKNGIVHFLPNIPGWKEVKLKLILEHKIGLPVFLDNDAKLMALAEYKKGAAKGSRNALCLTLGTGVGAGLIINGEIFRGFTNATGEIGHLPINEYGPKCNCGGQACLEAYIGNNAILKEAKSKFHKQISLEELSYLANKGDKKAADIWKNVGRRLGLALSAVVNLLSPDCIVIGGGVANAGKILFKEVKKTILERAMRVQARHVKILSAALGSDAGLFGAAILVNQGVEA
ncbi:MAG: ROK family protein [Candidatus Omnitrophica bacterium]|nr:ROK family protein [Candidatus Omnitrophota bacterium]MBU1928414.1 ROK family protein [Candidatus Omnitrophota bacterium]MBU2034296.1 ROK family protein [Candidatus Omnitrophota bacterium]MBU2222272.1 ROK family protein [Candidatus Omnitrophota bacterium]MBU2258663.1 ROK family protein [Candidatus Omnitrophota bacterium]